MEGCLYPTARPLRRPPPKPNRSTVAASRAPVRAIDLEQRAQRSVSPLELGLIELPTRPRSVYTMGQRKAAIESCEGGLLREAADLTLAAITESAYCRGILADLVQGLLGLRRTFTGDPAMVADLSGQFHHMFPNADTVRLMSWGITLGIAPGQMRRKYGARPSYDYPITPEEAANWKETRKQIGALRERPIGAPDIRVLRSWSPKWLRCQWWEDSAWYLMTADGEIRISHLDDPPNPNARPSMGQPIPDGNRDEWMLFTPFGETKPWEWGAWKSATLAFVAERDATFDRLRHAEVLAPMRVGKVPAGTTETQRKKYLRLLVEMKRMGLLVLPPGLEYDMVESKGRVADIYKAIIEWAQSEYAMITGALTTAAGASVYSKGGDVQERYTRSILSFFASALSECLHRYGFVPWSIRNYGTEDAPHVEWDPAAPEDKKTKAETLKIAGEALDKMVDSLAKVGRKPSDTSVEKFMQGLGFETEAIPPKTPHPKIDVTPTAREYAYRLGEVRASDGWPGFGDDRDNMTIADAEQLAKKKAEETPPPQGTGADDEIAPGDAPTDEDAHALAAKMTAYAVPACDHGRPNRCPLCGIERHRDFTPDPVTGEIRWHKEWKAIVRRKAAPTVAPVDPAPMTNGVGPHPGAWAQGGEA